MLSIVKKGTKLINSITSKFISFHDDLEVNTNTGEIILPNGDTYLILYFDNLLNIVIVEPKQNFKISSFTLSCIQSEIYRAKNILENLLKIIKNVEDDL